MNIQQLYDDKDNNNNLILNIVKYDKWLSLNKREYSDNILMLWVNKYYSNKQEFEK